MHYLKYELVLSFCLYVACFKEINFGCWPGNIVPYLITRDFSKSQVNHIKYQISILHNATCVRWLDLTNVDLKAKSLVEFTKTTGENCYLRKRYDKGDYIFYIELSDWCFEQNFVLHEMMHALGFEHEHQRPDRDCYVVVSEDAVKDDQYRILRRSYDGGGVWLERFPYDKYSIMHYHRSYKLKSKSERWYDLWEPLGNTEGLLTPLDIWKLLYKFCNFPHFCDVDPFYCDKVGKWEKECYPKRFGTVIPA